MTGAAVRAAVYAKTFRSGLATGRAKSAKPLKVSGAVDAVLVKYKRGSSTIEHAVAVFPSAERAQQNLLEVTRTVSDEVKVAGKVVRIKDDEGEPIGLGTHFDSDPEILCYRIGKLMAVLSGPAGKVVPVLSKSFPDE